MSGYPERVSANILPLSRSTDVAAALAEWWFTGTEIDNVVPELTCELCDHIDLRYHFLIRNRWTSHELWVGSECIKRFTEIAVFVGGRQLTGDEREQHMNARLTQLREATRKRMTMEVLHRLALGDARLADIPTFYDREEVFTPLQAVMVLRGCQREGIKVEREAIRIRLKKGKDNEQVLAMSDEDYALLRPCLSSAQRKRMDARRPGAAATRHATTAQWAPLLAMGETLAASDPQRGDAVNDIMRGIRSGRGLTMKQASLLLWRWKAIYHNESILTHLRITRGLPRDLEDIEDWKIRNLLPCLSEVQLSQVRSWRPDVLS